MKESGGGLERKALRAAFGPPSVKVLAGVIENSYFSDEEGPMAAQIVCCTAGSKARHPSV